MLFNSKSVIQLQKCYSTSKVFVPQHISHKYQQEMAKKSTIIPLPMQMKDEKKYEDVVDILDSYEQELEI